MVALSRFSGSVLGRLGLDGVRASLFVLAVLVVMVVASPPVEAASTASISGIVKDSHGNPITTQDVCVNAESTQYEVDEGEHTATTDSSGDYTIADLPAGSYKVFFYDCATSARNDVSQYYDDQSEYGSAAIIALSEGQAQTGIDASLAAATYIKGNVYGGAGTSTPLEEICVDVYSKSGSVEYPSQVRSGAGGAYTVAHLTPGIGYEVEFYDCGSSRVYLTQYYNGVSEGGAATSVTPTVANPSTGIDAHMEKGASISGTVTDASGHAITTEDICVYVYEAGLGQGGPYGARSGEARSDASGSYTIGALPAGSYDVYFFDCYGSARNDASQYYDHQDNLAFAEAVTLTAKQTQTGVDASLEAATTISGHVYGGSGTSTPLENICVSVYPAENSDVYYYTTVETGADGSYTLTHIEPNVAYDIEFYDCNSTREYVTQYYDGAASATNATTVTSTNSPLTGIDAHLEKGASISGAVTDSDGKPITTQDICVDAELQNSTGVSYIGSAITDASGHYSIIGLQAGSYKVYFEDCGDGSRDDLPQYYDGASAASSASLVVLSAGGVETGIDASMQPAATISGHVYGTSDTSTPLQGICVEALPVNGESQFYDEADTGADGSYTIGHLMPSVEYRVSFTYCNYPRKYLGQYYNGASYSSATILTPTSADPATGIDAHLEKGASISGTVMDSGGKPITTQDVCVTVDPASYEDDSENDYGNATTDSSGDYTVAGLAPGSYTVAFADCYYDSARNDLPRYYDEQSNAGSANAVTLAAEQEQTGIDASLQPATSISGHVYGGSGSANPLADICVQAFAASEGAAYDPVSSTSTVVDGSYTLLHLTPSTGYKVGFYDCGDPSAYETQFYEGAGEFGSAKTVTPGMSPETGIDAHLVKDPLQVTITGGPANGAASNATDTSFSFVSEVAGATFECQLDGKGFTPCVSPVQASTLNGGAALSNGTHTFSVEAMSDGKTGPVRTIYWTVNTGGPTSTSGGSTPAGGTFSSDPGQTPSASAPVITEVTVPQAAQITLTNEPATTPSANGYTVFGQQVRIAATDGSGNPVTGTAADPIALSFNLDATEVPAGTNLNEITVLRNGVPAANCVKGATAEPDPCVSSRTALPGGGAQIIVLTTHCSLWNFAKVNAGSEPESGEHTPPPPEEPTPGGTKTGSTESSGPSGVATAPSLQPAGGVLGTSTGRGVAPAKPLTRAQKLVKAIAACHKLKKSKRAKCVAAAKKRYGARQGTRKKRKG